MILRQPRYSSEEFARRGREIYSRVVLPGIRPEDDYKIVAIDIDSGDYEIDERAIAASDRLRLRKPDAQVWTERVGQPATYRIGGSGRTGVAK